MPFSDQFPKRIKRPLITTFALMVIIVGALTAPGTVYGATFTVNSANDVNDGTCNASHCSLREAINAANALGGPDSIAFNVGGGGVETIAPSSALPDISTPMTIDGTTQPGYAGAPLIEITGTSAGSGVSGLRIASAGAIIRGLSITGFASSNGIAAFGGSSGSIIEGNYVGLRPNGNALGNNQGIAVGTSGHAIGGVTAGDRNVIAGNLVNVSIQGGAGNVIQGNYIGTDPTGMVAKGGEIGVDIGSVVTDTLIGGDTPGARNVISGHALRGIQLFGSSSGSIIAGNYLGLNAGGTAALPNQWGVGILGDFVGSTIIRDNVIAGNLAGGVFDSGIDTVIQDNLIGVGPDAVTPMGNGSGGAGDAGILALNGFASDANPDVLNNTIAHTGGRGVRARPGTTPTIRGNRIYSNSGLGIDIDDDSATDAPCCMTITSATTNPGATIISGFVTAPPSTFWTLDFYDSAACDGSGFGEGQRYLGLQVVAMGGASFVSFNFVTSLGVSPGRVVTGTVNAASEFSSCVTVPACGGSDSDCDAWLSPQATKHIGPTNTDSATDNCENVWNTPQGNTDGNFIDTSPPYAVAVDDKTWARSDAQGNDCDADDDNDGLDDGVESGLPYGPCPTASGPTNPLLRDTDGDRVLDGAECSLGFDPLSSASKPTLTQCAPAGDSDGDKISDRVEFCYYNTLTNNTDSDGDRTLDGAKDGCEIASLNGDRVVSSGDQGMLAGGITGAFAYHQNVDINKDGLLNSGDQGLMASFISPPGQCP